MHSARPHPASYESSPMPPPWFRPDKVHPYKGTAADMYSQGEVCTYIQ